MHNESAAIKDFLFDLGADLASFGDITELPADHRRNMPFGIAVALKYPSKVIEDIVDMPTQEYFKYYNDLNEKLDFIVQSAAQKISDMGYNAIAQTREYARENALDEETVLIPHKTIATRAGLGWIGKCALLITKEFGSSVRLSSLLTDIPLQTNQPYNEGKCFNCRLCQQNCPAEAVKGKNWDIKTSRSELIDVNLCEKKARQRAAAIGVDAVICGRCIAVCPFTKRYIKENKNNKMK